ncbi:hypothetical protein Mycch_1100 [Mycolicibacterium chubuense NBB4]|uniref:Uncharacterized protein n=1 Tax=Mycolicibacterium chubuense (strain NBB4) TaxID=710421 RepID=I4BF51_MYCCN|nr:hypothetical protein [Mycolicibacterium chubuense]AFM15908.1 hypothetical protein Mycch_1100 [Mycolicibacterium chubuense NBB4]
MIVKNLSAATILAFGLAIAGVVGAGSAIAAPPTVGVDIAQKPHHDDGHDWNGPGPGRGHGYWGVGGWYPGIDACVSATGPYGYLSGYVCI